MRAVALIAAGCWALISQAMAFNIDGFYSGMTLEEVLKKLTATGIKAVPYPGTSQQLEAGPYRISFCKNDRGVAGVSKNLDLREFNSYLMNMIKNNGEPKVDISSPDLDILSLRWTLKDGSILALNSGMTTIMSTTSRFHNVDAIDNSFCEK